MTNTKETIEFETRVRLEARLVAPVIVRDMVVGREPLDDVAEFALHEMIGELRPDSALLCIALSVPYLVRDYAANAAARLLDLEACRIVEEYGDTWLAYASNRGTWDEVAEKDRLGHLAEDLDIMAVLMEDFKTSLPDDHCLVAILADILGLQAEMHKEIVEISGLEADIAAVADNTGTQQAEARESAKIIPFPAEAQKV